jgi:hypothetical protein
MMLRLLSQDVNAIELVLFSEATILMDDYKPTTTIDHTYLAVI